LDDDGGLLAELAAQRAQAAAQKALIARLRAELRDAKRRLRGDDSLDLPQLQPAGAGGGLGSGSGGFSGKAAPAPTAAAASNSGRWRTPSKALLLLEILGPGAVVRDSGVHACLS
jgi:hypothetical protein